MLHIPLELLLATDCIAVTLAVIALLLVVITKSLYVLFSVLVNISKISLLILVFDVTSTVSYCGISANSVECFATVFSTKSNKKTLSSCFFLYYTINTINSCLPSAISIAST